MCVEVVSKIDFNKAVNIKFKNILVGFDQYNYIDIHSLKNKKDEIEFDYIKSVEEFYDLNEGELIIDFYKSNLNEDSIENIKSNLDLNDITYFNNILNCVDNDNIYYKIKEKKYISLLIKLCTRELFFITFYFYKYPATLWGNYNLNFPLFYEGDYIDKYLTILKSNTLA